MVVFLKDPDEVKLALGIPTNDIVSSLLSLAQPYPLSQQG